MKLVSQIVLGAWLLSGIALRAQSLSVETAPPVVIKSKPEAGTAQVDPKLAEIQVTFSKEMMDGSWSWGIHTQDSFPKLAGKVRYQPDKRTCVLPVKLEAGKTYALWINSAKLTDFKDASGRSAVPYLLVFRTKD